MTTFELFDTLEITPSKNDKVQLLIDNDSPELRTLLTYVYHPYKNFYVVKLDDPTKFAEAQPDVFISLIQIMDRCNAREVTPTQARALIKSLMESGTENGAKWVARCIRKDLKCGFSASTINKAFPDLIPQYKIQKGEPMVAKKPDKKGNFKEYWSTLHYPVVVEEKYDGLRVTVVCDGVSVKYLSSAGNEFNLQAFDKDVLALRPGTKFVLDCEGCGIKLNLAVKKAKQAHDKDEPWQFSQAQSMIKAADKYTKADMQEYCALTVFDLVDYDWFLTQGKRGIGESLKTRKIELAGLFESGTFRNLLISPTYMANSKAEVIAIFDAIRARKGSMRGEGAMVKRLDRPYEFKRSDAILKMKDFKSADLMVDEVQMGTVDTKWEGHIGSVFVTDNSGVRGKLMSLGSEEERDELLLLHLRGDLVGAILEVDYMDITPDGSLRHAGYLNLRDDKTEISWD